MYQLAITIGALLSAVVLNATKDQNSHTAWRTPIAGMTSISLTTVVTNYTPQFNSLGLRSWLVVFCFYPNPPVIFC